MTGDMGEFWNDVRAARQAKRERNRESSPEVLRQAGIAFTTHNGDAHLIVKHGDKVADFWPGTGKFIIRNGRKGRGVRNLIAALRKEPTT